MSLQEILRVEFRKYSVGRRLRGVVMWAGTRMLQCRTAALGGHAEYCPEGHYVRSYYNSCKHRACPQCGGLDRARWVEAQVSRFSLSCAYHHVVFTVPHDLHVLWRYNRKLFGNVLFRAATESLREAFGIEAYVGALPGMVLTLHTWGRSLVEHVHVHGLVTAGGWTEGGWRSCRPGYFVLFDDLRGLYRKKVVGALRKALDRGELTVPRGMDGVSVGAELDRVESREWYVRVMPRYERADGVLRYFSRYVRTGPLKNEQILGYDGGQVTFRYRDHRMKTSCTVVLSVEEFLRRLFEHVPERGYRVIRYCGLFAPGNRKKLAACRRWLRMRPYEEPEPVTAAEYLASVGVEVVTHCPVCGRELLQIEWGRSPPRWMGSSRRVA